MTSVSDHTGSENSKHTCTTNNSATSKNDDRNKPYHGWIPNSRTFPYHYLNCLIWANMVYHGSENDLFTIVNAHLKLISIGNFSFIHCQLICSAFQVQLYPIIILSIASLPTANFSDHFDWIGLVQVSIESPLTVRSSCDCSIYRRILCQSSIRWEHSRCSFRILIPTICFGFGETWLIRV